MVRFEDTLMLVSREGHLSVREYINLEQVRHSVCDISRSSYPLVTDLSSFGITAPMIYNAFRDTRYNDAFFSRFDCNRLTSMHVPWDPKTIRLLNWGISCKDVKLLLQQCPNLEELPPIDLEGLDPIDIDILPVTDTDSGRQTRILKTVTLYCDVSTFTDLYLTVLRLEGGNTNTSAQKSPISVRHLEITVKISYNFDIRVSVGSFIEFVNEQFDMSVVETVKLFIASEDAATNYMDLCDLTDYTMTSLKLASLVERWSSVEDLSIVLEHRCANFILDGDSPVFHTMPSLKSFSIVPLLDDGTNSIGVSEMGTLDSMPALERFYIGKGSCYRLWYVDHHELPQDTRRDILLRKISVLNENKIENVEFLGIPDDMEISDIMVKIGESGCLKHLTIGSLTISPDALLQILKRNKGLQAITVRDCAGIGDKLFSLLAQAQLLNVSYLWAKPCSRPAVKRYIEWRVRQIERGWPLVDMQLENSDSFIVEYFPEMIEYFKNKAKVTLVTMCSD